MPDQNLLRLCLIGASFETDNMGVSALAAGAIKCVLHQYPDAQVFFLDYAQQPSRRTIRIGAREITVPLVNMRFSKKVYLANNISTLLLLAFLLRIFPWQRLHRWVLERNSCLKEIVQANAVLSVAGGDSFSDIYGMARYFYVTLPQVLVILLGKKLVLLPQTIGPFKSGPARVIARFILRRAEQSYSRDHRGEETVASLLGPSGAARVKFCYDMGFVVDSAPPVALDLVGLPFMSHPLVGLNVSGLLLMGGYTKKNMFGLKANYGELLCQLIEGFVLGKNASVLLVPHVFGSGENAESDVLACAKIYDRLQSRYGSRIGFIRSRHDQAEIKDLISECDFFVGSRMHACIAALSRQVPTVAIAYSDKFAAVVQTLGLQGVVADPRVMSDQEILAAIFSAYDQRASIHRELEIAVPRVKETVLNLFAHLALLPVEKEQTELPQVAVASS